MAKQRFLKTGFGYDSHRFLTPEEVEAAKNGRRETGTDYIDPDKPLILGGEVVNGNFPPMKSRSDGDAIFHAAVNAILSALALDEARDIGTLFPNNDPKNTNRNSAEFLEVARELLEKQNYVLNDLKLIIKGHPRVNLLSVRDNLAKILKVDREAVLVQGTSGEEMDDSGRGKGVDVFGVCTILHKEFFGRWFKES